MAEYEDKSGAIGLRFVTEEGKVAEGVIRRFKLPSVVETFVSRLPKRMRISIWKDAEIYFTVNVKQGVPKQHGTLNVKVGDIAYWPVGDAICVFYKAIKPYSSVGVIGEITSGLDVIEELKQGDFITVEIPEGK
ncbi:MAG: cyclophilin-like fold protein [Candidatus Ranarchaeia archaeon]|jgi:hypothetical protein